MRKRRQRVGRGPSISDDSAGRPGLQDPAGKRRQRVGVGPHANETMTSRTAAARYARALLDVAIAESADLDTVAREADEFIAFFAQQPALEGLLLNPAVPAPRKRAAMEQIARISGVTPIVAKLLVLLADRDRLGLLKEIASGTAIFWPSGRTWFTRK